LTVIARPNPSQPERSSSSAEKKKGFGFHPLLGFVDHGGPSGGEPVCELLRPGKAGSNTAADHVVVLDAAERLREWGRATTSSRRHGQLAALSGEGEHPAQVKVCAAL
jgi:hypothetical protein